MTAAADGRDDGFFILPEVPRFPSSCLGTDYMLIGLFIIISSIFPNLLIRPF